MNPMEEMLDNVEQLRHNDGKVTVNDVVEQVGHRGYGPFLVLPALVELTPVGGIPGVPTLLASTILLFALQMLAGRTYIWVPAWVGRRTVSSDKLAIVTQRLQKVSRGISWVFRERLARLARRPFSQVAGLLSACLALTVPALEVIPFASSAPMVVIAVFGLSLLFKDGLLMVVACIACIASFYFGFALAT